jgi:hypothetical protein
MRCFDFDDLLQQEKRKILQEITDMKMTDDRVDGFRRRRLHRKKYADQDIDMLVPRYLDLISTLERIDKILYNRSVLNTESGIPLMDIVGDSPDVKTEENLEDTARTMDYRDIGTGDDPKYLENVSVELSTFLSRPIQIANGTIDLSSNYVARYRLLSDYLLEPSVRAKLKNYAYMRANLHCRIVFSGTPYHMGKILVSYLPWSDANSTFQLYLPALGSTITQDNYLSWLSQLRNSKMVDVRANEPVEFSIPYISPAPYLRLYNQSTSVLSSATSFADAYHHGELIVHTMRPIVAVTPDATKINYTLYVWLDEVMLSGPTSTQLVLDTEAGNDERKTGPIERISSALSQATFQLGKIPIVGPYAMASSIALGALTKVSALFGWSYPVDAGKIFQFKPRTHGNTALTVGIDPIYKLAMDPKQELTVDPRMFGGAEDEMTIQYICGRPSYLQTNDWSPLDTPLLARILNIPVTPKWSPYYDDGTNTFIQPTSLAFAANPFHNWHGDITYVFTIACSAFHRGKVAVYWEPNVNHYALIEAAPIALNKHFITIIDISETQTFSVTIKWNKHKAWLENLPNQFIDLSVPDQELYANGYISVVPFTKLQSPDDQPINIHTSVYSDYMRFALPVDSFPRSRLMYEVESGLCGDDIYHTTLNENNSNDTTIYMNHFGEAPISFRALLKRYMPVYTYIAAAFSSVLYSQAVTTQILPEYAPAVGANSTSGKHVNLYSYLATSYLAMRGGVKKKIRAYGLGGGSYAANRARLDAPTNVTPAFGITNVDYAAAATGYNSLTTMSFNGMILFGDNDKAMDLSIPFFSDNLFVFSCNNTFYDVAISPFNNYLTRTCTFTVENRNASSFKTIWQEDMAVDEDFSFFHYLSATPYSMASP